MRAPSYKVRGNNHWKLLNIQGKLWGSLATWHSNKLPQYTQTWNLLPTICTVHTFALSSWLLQVLPAFERSHSPKFKLRRLSPFELLDQEMLRPLSIRCPSEIFGNVITEHALILPLGVTKPVFKLWHRVLRYTAMCTRIDIVSTSIIEHNNNMDIYVWVIYMWQVWTSYITDTKKTICVS